MSLPNPPSTPQVRPQPSLGAKLHQLLDELWSYLISSDDNADLSSLPEGLQSLFSEVQQAFARKPAIFDAFFSWVDRSSTFIQKQKRQERKQREYVAKFKMLMAQMKDANLSAMVEVENTQHELSALLLAKAKLAQELETAQTKSNEDRAALAAEYQRNTKLVLDYGKLNGTVQDVLAQIQEHRNEHGEMVASLSSKDLEIVALKAQVALLHETLNGVCTDPQYEDRRQVTSRPAEQAEFDTSLVSCTISDTTNQNITPQQQSETHNLPLDIPSTAIPSEIPALPEDQQGLSVGDQIPYGFHGPATKRGLVAEIPKTSMDSRTNDCNNQDTQSSSDVHSSTYPSGTSRSNPLTTIPSRYHSNPTQNDKQLLLTKPVGRSHMKFYRSKPRQKGATKRLKETQLLYRRYCGRHLIHPQRLNENNSSHRYPFGPVPVFVDKTLEATKLKVSAEDLDGLWTGVCSEVEKVILASKGEGASAKLAQ